MSSLSHRGYAVLKDDMTPEDLSLHRRNLTVKPFVLQEFAGTVQRFPVYAESKKRLYVPRHYGLKEFGTPDKILFADYEKIDLKFQGSLRPKQVAAVNKVLDECPIDKTPESYQKNKKGGVLSLHTGFGKCLGIDTPIMMYDGKIKMVQDVVVGDKIMGDDSTPRTILSLARGREMLYDVIPTKGEIYTVNESHILSLKCSYTIDKKNREKRVENDVYQQTPHFTHGDIIDIEVRDYLQLAKTNRNHGLKGYRVPIEFPEKEVDIDPYTMGYWLGGGTSKTGISSLGNVHFRNRKEYDIPHKYMCNSRENRLQLLAGLLDSGGSSSKNGFNIVHKKEKLLDGVIFLARSLGFAAYKTFEDKKSFVYKGRMQSGPYYQTKIHGPGIEGIPVQCLRPQNPENQENQEKTPFKNENVLLTEIRLEKKGIGDYYGFEIDGNKRFVLGDCTVTHNTVCALNIIAQLKAKTLIIVHKTFLMNQWKERIATFLPDAKVGIIQQKKIEIEGKEIVIAMLQSISMKEYPKTMFNPFGLCIVDEAHHLGAEVFSRCLSKIGCEFNIGLSATPKRADGLTKVFEWWLGPVLYKVEKRADMDVNAIQIKINDSTKPYSREELSQYGKICMPRMVNNVCAYAARTNLIVHILKLLVRDGRTILVLSGRRQHLKDIFDACTEQEAGSVGFYMGGMKPEDLKESEEKKIILGTYTMAAEGLDIKALNTILLASPMSNVVQAVGRILRQKHAHITPEIYDIVDNFSCFVNQSVKRRRFYSREEYPVYVKEIDSCIDAWKEIPDLKCMKTVEFSSKRKKKKKKKEECLFLE